MKTLKQKTEGEQWFTQLCIDLEHFETPVWPVIAVLKKEILTDVVVDPCTGTGIIARVAHDLGHEVFTMDVQKWEGIQPTFIGDYLTDERIESYPKDATVLMNPPFSLAEKFVERSLALGARKILCFQRYAWYESSGRKEFWDKHPPNRIWVCADRASCWRHDIPVNEKGRRYDPETGKELAGTSTAHAWFVWEPELMPGTLTGRLYKP